MKAKAISLFKLFTTILLMTVAFSSKAQKQPQVQQVSVRAPDNIKIDGKINEWASLQAYNSTSRIHYTVSNDDNNLYLTIRGLGQRVALKSIRGGLVFTVNSSADKKQRDGANNVTITFPVSLDREAVNNIMNPQYLITPLLKDTLANAKQIDSLVALSNQRLTDALKEIRLSGVKEIADSSLSIYNTNGIKAKMLFKKIQPIIELAIPLKYLGVSINSFQKFSYNIKINGDPNLPAGADVDQNSDQLYLAYSTDFWGEYILAKKP